MEDASVAYRQMLTVSVTRSQQVLMHVNNYDVGIHNQLGLRRRQLVATEQEHDKPTLKT